jgi:hypothetical protein
MVRDERNPMTALPLITSLPPVLSRLDRQGRDIGADYQRLCLRSWREAGFQVFSLNPPDEAAVLRERFPEVEFVSPPGDARALYGRPYAWLHDVFRLGESLDAPVFGLVNADIVLNGGPGFAGALAGPARGSCLFSYRLNRKQAWLEPDAATAAAGLRSELADEAYIYGFDLFFFDRTLARLFDEDVFALGVPWWDLWVPLNLLFHDVPLRLFRSPPALHLAHSLNWQPAFWRQLYQRMGELMRQRALIDVGRLRAAAPPAGMPPGIPAPDRFAATFLGAIFDKFRYGDEFRPDVPAHCQTVDAMIQFFSVHCVHFILASPRLSVL